MSWITLIVALAVLSALSFTGRGFLGWVAAVGIGLLGWRIAGMHHHALFATCVIAAVLLGSYFVGMQVR